MDAEKGGGGLVQAQASEETMGKIEQQLRKAPIKRERTGGCATTAKERISKMPPCVAGKRSSIYRGVTRHRWTGRYEAHLWDKSTWNQNQNKKGKQVYLGAYDDEEAAARAYDLAALKYWGAGTLINFPVSDYSRDLEEMQSISKEEYLVSLRRKSSAFSRGFPKCRGASRNLQSNRPEISLSQMLDSEYNLSFNGLTDPMMNKNYATGFSVERKIDLTGYIRWWLPKRMHHEDSLMKTFDENYVNSEDINPELRLLECSRKPTEPYQLPSLGIPCELKTHASAISASTFLARSAAFKNFHQKMTEMHVPDKVFSKRDKSITILPDYGEMERTGIALGFSGLPLEKMNSRIPHLSVPLKSDWNSGDPASDAIVWANIVPPSSLGLPATIQKVEASTAYNCKE